MMPPWLTVIGIGADGVEGLSGAARALVAGAEVLVGGVRHLRHVEVPTAKKIRWGKDFQQDIKALSAYEGSKVVVLASGDPLYYGAATSLIRTYGSDAVRVIPTPGAASLACAHMGWSLPDIEVLTVHGRALQRLHYHLFDGVNLLIFSRDGETPAEIAHLLVARGFADSLVTVMEHLGGPRESGFSAKAADWPAARAADLNMVAVACVAGPDAKVYPRVPGLPDDAYDHDGQITKRVVRAATLAALGPCPGELLWDIGAGAGSVAIEWLRAEPSARAVAFERDPARAERIAVNAYALGVPLLDVVQGGAIDVLHGREDSPDAVFLGGGVGRGDLVDTVWSLLKPGRRLVANGVTASAEARLMRARDEWGGTLTRIAVSTEEMVGGQVSLKPAYPILQWAAVKP